MAQKYMTVDQNILLLSETHFNSLSKHRLKVKGCKTTLQAYYFPIKAGVANLVLANIDFRHKNAIRGAGTVACRKLSALSG